MKRIPIRRTLLALAALVALLAVYLGYQRVSGKRAYEAWAKAARATGEKLTVKEVKELFVVPEGFDVLSEADLAALLENLDCDLRPEPNVVATGLYARPTGGWAGDTWLDFEGKPHPWADLREKCAKHLPPFQTLLARLDAGPFLVRPRYDWESDLPIFDLIQTALYCQSWTALRLHEGRPEEAALWLRRALRLQRAIADQPRLVGQIGHLAMHSINSKTAWAVVEGAALGDADLAQLDGLWADTRPLAALLHGLECERAQVLSLFPGGEQEQLVANIGLEGLWSRHTGRQHSAPRGLAEMIMATLSILPERTQYTLWRMAWHHADRLTYAQALQKDIDRLRAIIDDRHSGAAGAFRAAARPKPTRLQAISRPVSALAIPRVLLVATDAAMAETLRNLIRTAIALKRFQLRHGALPATLEELVPDLLEELPWDWQAGRPLTYRLRDDGSFLLYSWGEDQVDDGGEPGQDTVWLPAAPPESEQQSSSP